MKKTKYPRGVYVAMICLSMLFAVTYSVPYVKSVFYDGMLAMTKVSNEKLGILMTIYGLGEILTLGIGGVIANRFNHRAIIVISSLGTALGCLLFALFPSFAMSLIVWTILVFSTLFMVWGTLFKAMRLMVSDEQQGELAGWFAGLIGLNYLIVNIVCLGVYSLFGKGNDVAGMKAVFYTFAILMVIFTFVTSFALKKVGIRNETALAEAKDGTTQSFFSDLKAVVRYRSVWYFGGTLFCIYSATVTITYFTPYFTDVLGVAAGLAGVIAIVRSYGTKLIGAPLGGVVAGKIKSVTTTIIYTFVGAAACLLVTLLVPGGKSQGIVITITVFVMLAALFNNAGNGIQYALPTEGKVPVRYYAAAIGFGSALGFLPDLYQHVLFGYWIDTYGKAGYSYIFLYGIIASVLGMGLLLIYNVDLKRQAKIPEAVH